MNYNNIAKRVANSIIASNIDIMDGYRKVFNNVAKRVEKTISKTRGVENVKIKNINNSFLSTYSITLTGYTRSDFSAKCSVVLNFNAKTNKNNVTVWGTRPDWEDKGDNIIYKDFGMILPLDLIVSKVELIFD